MFVYLPSPSFIPSAFHQAQRALGKIQIKLCELEISVKTPEMNIVAIFAIFNRVN